MTNAKRIRNGLIAAVTLVWALFLCGIVAACNEIPKDSPPSCNKNDIERGDPVSVTTGKLHSSHCDISVPGRGGVSLELTRHYYGISGHEYMGPFGRAWNFNYGMKIDSKSSECLELINEQGETEVYNLDWDGWNWKPPKGNFSKLTGSSGAGWTLKRKGGKAYTFNSKGELVNITDRNGNQLVFSYVNSRLDSVSDPCSRRLIFGYNSNGLISRITRPDGSFVTYEYDGSNNLIKVTDPADNSIIYGYSLFDFYNGLIYVEDVYWQLSSVTDPNGNTTSFSFYDETPGSADYLKCKRITYSDDAHTDFYYNNSLRFTIVTDERGNPVKYDYDRDNNVTQVTGPYGDAVVYVYDEDFNRISSTDAEVHTTRYSYDERGNCLTITDPMGRISRFTYEPEYDFIKTASDNMGNTTTYYYDYESSGSGCGNVVRIVRPAVDGISAVELFEYNQHGQLAKHTDAAGIMTKFEYYADNGYLQRKILDHGDSSHVNSTTEYAYDTLGNAISVTDPLGRTSTFRYNPAGLLIEKVSPAPYYYRIQYAYDNNGNPIRISRQLNEYGSQWAVTVNTYEKGGCGKANRLASTREYLSDTDFVETVFRYDECGNRIESIDPNSNSTLYEYDALNRLTKTIDAEGGITENTYYLDGKLKTIKDPNYNVTRYEYDAANFLTKTIYPDSSYEEYVPDANSNIISKRTRRGELITYTYDALNRITAKECASYTPVSYAYDIRSRITSITGAEPVSYEYDNLGRVTETAMGGKSVGYEYDIAGNRTKLIYPDNSYITYEYDTLNRLKEIKDGSGNSVCSYSYDPLSRRVGLVYANGRSVSYSYNNLSRLTNKANTGISGFSYTYDNAGNRLTMTAHSGTHGYTYNRIYEVTGVDYPSGYPFSDIEYDYDPAGNRTRAAGSVLEIYSPNNLNQYIQVNQTAYTYDGNGNLTNDGAGSYSYDYENRLLTASAPEISAEYSYDPLGRRVRKQANGQITAYIHDGDQIIAEYDSTGTLARKFVYGPGIDEPIKGLSPQGTVPEWFYHSDGLGSITELTDSTGSVIEKYSYDIFGSVIIKDAQDNVLSQSTVDNPYFFTARQLDTETGLYYYRARYYNPGIGRFLQTDPVGYSAGLNLYAYVDNNSVNYVDPHGLAKVELRYNKLGSIGKFGYYHAYIVITDKDKSQYYFRGGPTKGGPSGGTSGILSSGLGGRSSASSGSNKRCSNSSNSTSPGSGPGGNNQTGPWGAIEAVSGPYILGTVDYTTDNVPTVVIVDDGLPASEYIDKLDKYGEKINKANIPYNPFNNNSNSVAHGAVKGLGFTHTKSPVWAPGANSSLSKYLE